METENKGLIDVRDCPCDGCQAKPCGHPARCVKFTLWLNKTVDAVEVVCCKDCKHWQYRENGFGYCKNPRFHIPGVAEITMNAEDYCSLGERKAE